VRRALHHSQLQVRERHGLAARYIRNAGAFGALFILMQEPRIASPRISE
jgi:hypothetical protein